MPSLEELDMFFGAPSQEEPVAFQFSVTPDLEVLLEEARRIEESSAIISPEGRRRLREINKVLRKALREVM
jgi:hypothetical protein